MVFVFNDGETNCTKQFKVLGSRIFNICTRFLRWAIYTRIDLNSIPTLYQKRSDIFQIKWFVINYIWLKLCGTIYSLNKNLWFVYYYSLKKRISYLWFNIAKWFNTHFLYSFFPISLNDCDKTNCCKCSIFCYYRSVLGVFVMSLYTYTNRFISNKTC